MDFFVAIECYDSLQMMKCIYIAILHLAFAKDMCIIKNVSSFDDLSTKCMDSEDWNTVFNEIYFSPKKLVHVIDSNLEKYISNRSNIDCFASHFARDFTKNMETHENAFEDSIKMQCPLGLLFNIVCTYSLCWNNLCILNNTQYLLNMLCKDDVTNFINSCFAPIENYALTDEILDAASIDSLPNFNCFNLNLTYQGLTSLTPIIENKILVSCNHATNNIDLKCLISGQQQQNVHWNVEVDGIKISNASISFEAMKSVENVPISCSFNNVTAMDMLSNNTCENKTRYRNKRYTKDFYQNYNSYFPKDSVTFNNNNHQSILSSNFFIAAVSITGQNFPICGDNWTGASAAVFCREVGNQYKQSWVVVYHGKIRSSSKHYLGGLNCTGNESNIIWCDHDGWYDYGQYEDCKYDAIVYCSKDSEGRAISLLVMISSVTVAVVVLIIIILGLYYYISKYQKYYPGVARTESTGVVSSTDNDNTLVSNASNFSSSINKSISNFFNFYSFPTPQVVPSVQKIDEVCGKVIKKLNPINSPENVLLFQLSTSSKYVVCKSYKDKDDCITERKFLSDFDHANIVQYLKGLNPQDIEYNSIPRNMFFMEYLDVGSLDCHLENKGHTLDVKNATNIIKGILEALKYVHEKGFVHGDISSDNFFLFLNNSGLLDVKLGDFESIYEPKDKKFKSVRSTARFTSPECLLSDDTADAFKNEIWGIGLVIWEVQSYVSCFNNKETKIPQSYKKDTNCIQLSRFPDNNDNLCTRASHFALYKQLGTHNSKEITDKPGADLMKGFYRDNNKDISLPFLRHDIDAIFNGLPIRRLIKNCLTIDPLERPSAVDIADLMRLPTNPEELQDLGYLGAIDLSVVISSPEKKTHCIIL